MMQMTTGFTHSSSLNFSYEEAIKELRLQWMLDSYFHAS